MNLRQFTPLRENSMWAVLATLSAVVFGCERANEVEYELSRLGAPCSSTGYLLWSNDGFAPTDREALVKEIRRLQALENKPHIDKNVEIFLAKGFHDVNVLEQKGDRHRWLLLLAVEARSRGGGRFVRVMSDRRQTAFLDEIHARDRFGSLLIDEVARKAGFSWNTPSTTAQEAR